MTKSYDKEICPGEQKRNLLGHLLSSHFFFFLTIKFSLSLRKEEKGRKSNRKNEETRKMYISSSSSLLFIFRKEKRESRGREVFFSFSLFSIKRVKIKKKERKIPFFFLIFTRNIHFCKKIGKKKRSILRPYQVLRVLGDVFCYKHIEKALPRKWKGFFSFWPPVFSSFTRYHLYRCSQNEFLIMRKKGK